MRPRREVQNNGSLNIIGVPVKFHSTTIEDFNTFDSVELQRVKDYVANYIKTISTLPPHNKEGILFFGSNGVGKTMLASLILKEAYMYRYSCKRMTFVDYINLYTQAWGAKTPQERNDLVYDLNMKAKGVDYLLLEEVGKEIDSKVATPILEDLLRYREDKGLVTIICTNVKPSDLADRYGASVMSLMRGNMYPIKIVGEDKRGVI